MKHKTRKFMSLALALALALSLVPGMALTASAAENSTSYILTIPAELNVADSGWNATAGIKAAVSGGTFDSNKKLTVTAASTNSWTLKASGVTDGIGYNLATATGTYDANAAPASWSFSANKLNANGGTTKPMGIIVDDYSTKPAGIYQDTVTFTASVVNAVSTLDATTTTAWADDDTYIVPANGLTYNDAITVTGDVTLTLTDGVTLTLNKGISLAEGATLTVEGNGILNINGTNNSPASTVAGSTGTLVLTSGTLNATGGNGAGLGDAKGNQDVSANAGGVAINGNVTVSGGTLTATGGNGGGIGKSSNNAKAAAGGAAISGSVTISSGAVTATGGNGGSIGDFSVNAVGGAGGAAIAGDATLTGGTLTKTDGSGGSIGRASSPAVSGAAGKAVAGTYKEGTVVRVTAITLNKTTLFIFLGSVETETLSVSSVTPDNADDKTVTWSSDNTSVATVDATTGKVTAVTSGTANITATANDDSGVTATCTVTVSSIPGNASQLKEASSYSGSFSDAGFCNDGNTALNGKTITVDEAKVLAAYQKLQTNNPTAIIYSGSVGTLYFAKDDGTTGEVTVMLQISNSALNGYKIYCVNN